MVDSTEQLENYSKNYSIKWDTNKSTNSNVESITKSNSTIDNLTKDVVAVETKSPGILNTNINTIQPAVSSSTLSPYSSYIQNYDLDNPDSPQHKAQTTQWYYNPVYGSARNLNISSLRSWASLEAIQICVNKLIKRIKRLDWDIVIKDQTLSDEEKEKLEPKRQELVNFFQYCNGRGEEISDVLASMLRDSYTLDAGVIVKTFNLKGELVEIGAYDGGTFVRNFDVHGMPPTVNNYLADGTRIPAYFQYSIVNTGRGPLPFYDEEIVYFIQNLKSYSFYGTSPVEILKERTLKYLFRSGKFNAEYFEKNAVPAAIISTQGMNETNRKRAMDFWNAKVKGNDHKVQFIDGELVINQLQPSQKDMEFIEGSKFFLNQTAQIYGLNANSIGITDSVGSKNVSENQSEQVDIDAVLPTLEMIERKLTNEIIPHFFSKPETDTMGNLVNVITKEEVFDTPFEFKYLITDTAEEQRKFQNMLSEVGMGTLTRDEFRQEMGREALPEEKEFEDNDPKKDNKEDDKDEKESTNESDKEDKDKNIQREPISKRITKQQDLPEVDTETSAYDKTINRFEKQYMSIYSKMDTSNYQSTIDILDNISTDQLKNNFNDVTKDVDRALNQNLLVMTGLVSGIVSTMFATSYEQVESQSNRQFNIPSTLDSVKLKENMTVSNVDLITNVSQDQSKGIVQTLQSGIDNNKSIPQIKKDLVPIINSETRAEAIARTEVLKTFGKSADQAARDAEIFQYKM